MISSDTKYVRLTPMGNLSVLGRFPAWSRYRALTKGCALVLVFLCFSSVVYVSRIYLFTQPVERTGMVGMLQTCTNCSSGVRSSSQRLHGDENRIGYRQGTGDQQTRPAEKTITEDAIDLLSHPATFGGGNARQLETPHQQLVPNQADDEGSRFASEDSVEKSLEEQQDASKFEGNQQVKKFFYFNPRPGNRDWAEFDNCEEYSACAMADSVDEADVILFNAARMKHVPILPRRRPNQIWVMYSREPPDLPSMDALDRPDLLNQVNYTRMVYSDSTWQVRYGILRETTPPRKNYEKIFRKKRFDVAWFVSHCERPSRRMEYVQRMMSTVDIHIYGSCGNYTCGDRGYNMGGKKDECLDMLSRDYKFYLSFENTLCRDYISEKFFNSFEGVDVLPVVRGGGDYQKLFPSEIFVDASDFPSPESLGTYLKHLGRDEKGYIKMLRKKNRYRKSRYKVDFYCDLCKRALTGKPQHFYGNFYQWVRAPGNCWKPTDLGPVQN